MSNLSSNQRQNNHPEISSSNPENFSTQAVEYFQNREKLLENPQKAVEDFAQTKIDQVSTGFMEKASEGISKYTPEWLKKIGAFLEEHFSFLGKIKDWFGEKISGIGSWITGGIGGILGIDLLKKGIEKGTDYVKQGKDLFFSFLEGVSFGPLKEFTGKIKAFVENIDFKDIKKVFTNPKEIMQEIKRRVSEEFPEVAYYFAIADAEKEKNQEKKINLQQIALFDFAIGHFKTKPELTDKLKNLKGKVEKGGYSSLTQGDWEEIEKEIKKSGYKDLIEIDGMYYFDKEGEIGDMFLLGYMPNQAIEKIAEIDISKLAISNALYQKTKEGVGIIEKSLNPFLEELPENIKEHFANHDLNSFGWYTELFAMLQEASIPYLLTSSGFSVYNLGKEYVFESCSVAWETLWGIFSLRSWEDVEAEGIEYLKGCVPLMVMGGAIAGGKAMLMVPHRIAQDLIRGNFTFLGTISKTLIDVTKGATIYGLGAPITVPKKIIKTAWGMRKGKQTLEHIPQTIKYNLAELKHNYVNNPLNAGKQLLGFKHKEAVLYEDLLFYKEIEAYYTSRKIDEVWEKGAQEKLDKVRKEIGNLEDIIKKRKDKNHLKEFGELVDKKVKTLENNPEIEKKFTEFLEKNKITNKLNVRDDWNKMIALEELQKEGKIGRIKELKAYQDYLGNSLKNKITAFKNFTKHTKNLYGKTVSGVIFKEIYETSKDKLKKTGDKIKDKTKIIHENNFAESEQKQTFSERSKEVSLEVNAKLDKLGVDADSAYKNLIDATVSGDKTKIEKAKQAVSEIQNKIKSSLKNYKNANLDAMKTRPIGHFTKVTLKGATTIFVGMEATRIVHLIMSGEKKSALKSGLDLTAQLAPITGTYLDGKEALNHFKSGEIWEGAVSGTFALMGGVSDILLLSGLGTAFGAGGRAGLVALKAGRIATKGTKLAKINTLGIKAKEGIKLGSETIETGIKTTAKILGKKEITALSAAGIGGLALYFSENIPPTEEEIK